VEICRCSTSGGIQGVQRESWTVRAPFCVDRQKADGFTLDIQEIVTDEIQVGSYMDLWLGSGERRKGREKNQWSLEAAADVS